MCGASPPRLLRERTQEKFNESRERESLDERKTRDEDNTAPTVTRSRSDCEAIDEDTKKEKRKLFERFRASVRALLFFRAFRPQDALVFHRKTEG